MGKYLNAFFTLALLFSKNNLLSSNQSGFRTEDSCINKILSINHEILRSFDMGYSSISPKLLTMA